MYNWVIFVHVLGVFGFLLGHGTAAAITFKLRGERGVERVRALLDLSQATRVVANASLLVLLVAGIVAGFMGHWWGRGWIWASLGLLVVIGIAMTVLGSRPLARVRQLVQPSRAKANAERSLDAAADEQLTAMLAAVNPVLLTVIGGGGLALILWLMMFKPF